MMDHEALQRDLGRVEGKLDSLIDMIKGQGTSHAALETRVRRVEGRLLYFSGGAAGLAFFLAKLDFTKIIAVATHQ